MSKQMKWLNEYEVTDEYARKMIDLIFTYLVDVTEGDVYLSSQTGSAYDEESGKYSAKYILHYEVSTVFPDYKVTINGTDDYYCHISGDDEGPQKLIDKKDGEVIVELSSRYNGAEMTVYSDSEITSVDIKCMYNVRLNT